MMSSSDTVNSSHIYASHSQGSHIYASHSQGDASVISDTGGRQCTWFCTREEPIIYINEKPYVLREEDSPLKNLTTCMGINADRLEQLEQRLKQEVIREATRNNNLILVHDELVDGRIIPFWVVAERIQTPREVQLFGIYI